MPCAALFPGMRTFGGLFLCLVSASCMTNSDVKESIRALERSQFSAKGSDLTLAVCGWQPVEKMEFTRITADLFPDSNRDRGRGYLHIDAKGRAFTCSSKIFFTYTSSYTGGHGSYENYTNFALFQRENAVLPQVSRPEHARPVRMGEERHGSIDGASRKLPDGSLADFYSLAAEKKTGMRIELRRDASAEQSSFHPRAYAYQNQKLLFRDDEQSVVEAGTVHILVTSGLEGGRYKMRIVEMPEDGMQ